MDFNAEGCVRPDAYAAIIYWGGAAYMGSGGLPPAPRRLPHVMQRLPLAPTVRGDPVRGWATMQWRCRRPASPAAILPTWAAASSSCPPAWSPLTCSGGAAYRAGRLNEIEYTG